MGHPFHRLENNPRMSNRPILRVTAMDGFVFEAQALPFIPQTPGDVDTAAH